MSWLVFPKVKTSDFELWRVAVGIAERGSGLGVGNGLLSASMMARLKSYILQPNPSRVENKVADTKYR
jgi:hypothetical protein